MNARRIDIPSILALSTGRRSLLLMAAFGIIWALGDLTFESQLVARYPLMEVVWCRYGVHLLLMLSVWALNQPQRLWRTSRPVFQVARSMLMLVMPLSFMLAVKRVGTYPDVVMAEFWLAPALVAGLAWLLLRERVAGAIWLIVGVTTLVAVAMEAPAHHAALSDLALPGLMALSFSGYVVMTRALKSEPTVANLFYTALGVFVVLTPFMPSMWITPNWRDAVSLAGLGIAGFFGLLALDRAAAYAPVANTAALLPIQLVVFAFVEILVNHQHLTHRTLLGGVMLCIAAIYLWLREGPSVSGAAPSLSSGPHP